MANMQASPFVGHSPVLQQARHQLQEVAPTDLTVLLLGETGTGKGVAARALHQWSSRPHQPFVHLDCSSLPPSLIDSELFGHEKGAFTGASLQRKGRIEQAQGGTLFLDEIGELPLEAQARLLRLLQDRLIERLGGSQPLHLDVRVIATTHRDLAQAVKDGTFRQDLPPARLSRAPAGPAPATRGHPAPGRTLPRADAAPAPGTPSAPQPRRPPGAPGPPLARQRARTRTPAPALSGPGQGRGDPARASGL
ncbi:MAG: sigma 54-interacting transcriptional regulator [Candidatus Latescibacteria bacterium]|nr:sigma 54-interacting transcriptional regulator [Candidatus Latescibacterota bacterium]